MAAELNNEPISAAALKRLVERLHGLEKVVTHHYEEGTRGLVADLEELQEALESCAKAFYTHLPLNNGKRDCGPLCEYEEDCVPCTPPTT